MRFILFVLVLIAATCQCCYQPVTTAPPGYLPHALKTVDSLIPLFLWEEPDLHRRYSGHDIYRLHWYCCYNLHRYITLHRQNDTVWLETKQIGKFINPLTREMHNERLGPGGDYDVVCFKKRLTEFEWHEFDSLLNHHDFWNMPMTDNIRYIDGYSFTLEAHLRDKYHIVRQEVPKGVFKEIGLYLIRLAGYENEEDM